MADSTLPGVAASPPSSGDASVERETFGAMPDGREVELFRLRNAGGMEVRLATYGGTVVSLKAPDRDGVFADVALGYATFEEYLADRVWFGPLIGRSANRIAGGRFTLDGREYVLPLNDGPNHLHGGPGGFDKALWGAEPFHAADGVGVVLTHTSPAGTDGYPGTLHVRVTVTLTERNELDLAYRAATDAATPVNITQHSYFNLAGEGSGDVLGHDLTLNASRFTPLGPTMVPSGELRPVAGTPFDFTVPTPIGARIDADDEQLRTTGGYDHNFMLNRRGNGLELAARLYDPGSGRVLEVLTTEPGIQLYTGNGLDGSIVGRSGRPYGRRSGVALETQHFPDAPNQPGFPSTILRPGQEFASRTVYRFGARGRDSAR
jgi:aldose 1-epimerase